ncbi:MAG: hypothetical protein DLM73_16165 [Chthoniobacterales bacterium]|nr:MAG: hypothetical protein DLM73_16165 [Chthoniobacterales bacterium]
MPVLKKISSNQSGLSILRLALASSFVTLSGLLGFLAFAAAPPSGTVSPNGPNVAWAGTGTGVPPAAGGEGDCTDPESNCDAYKLTISGTPADWIAAGKQVHVQINWTLPSTDYDMYIHKGTVKGPIVASSGAGGTTQEQVDMNPASSNIGTGDFVVHVVYFAPNPGDQYNGVATVVSAGNPPIPAPSPISGFPPRFENYNPPAAGPGTLGRASGEPSIGFGQEIPGHPEGRALFQADVQTLRVTFNGCAKALWENKPAPTSQEDFDPILWSDRATGRTIVHLLTFAGNVIAGESSVTDTAPPGNDGDVWTPSKGSGIGSGVDHQTVGGGPFAPPLNLILRPYPNAVYYCSQALVDASCARSDDGGINYGASTVIYSSECGGLHGHVKVAPDGTVYVPNKGCGTQQGVVVSEDNGLTWNIRKVPASTSSGSDPSLGTGSGGRVYFGYADGDTKAVITTSTDKGVTWTQPLDVGAALGINNVVFPAVIAGDDDRAAFAFLGTPTAGGLQGPKFAGTWHLYVATTYDGGATWATVDATPNNAVQRGCIWLGGGANICRNLLDFMDVQMDQVGRIVVGYADGCTGGECAQAPATATGNAYTALAAIARQSGGRRLLALKDPPDAQTGTAPGTPSLSAKRNIGVVGLSWSEADNGGSTVNAYNILRGTSAGAEVPLATVAGTQLTYVDNTATDPAVTYFYKVTASNGQGTSCGDNEISARFTGSSYSTGGFIVAADPTGDQTGAPANADLDLQSLAIAEPGSGANAGKLVFNLKVADLTTIPNSRMWRIIWNSPNSPGSQFYLGMTNDASGNLTFDYGTVATATVGLVLGVQTTTRVGSPDFGGFTPSGLITIVVSKDKVGNPHVDDLLGALTARTYATVTDQIRTTNAIDTTANANANDATANAAVYALVGPEPAVPPPSPTPTATPSATPTATPSATPTATPTPTPTATPTATPTNVQLLNISGRVFAQSGPKVGIGGFIVTGSGFKRVIVRALGPSISVGGQPVPGTLQDPVLELHDSKGGVITNDNWRSSQEAEIQQSGLAPKDNREAAIVATLPAGNYTGIIYGASGTGIGLVEIYDLNSGSSNELGNLSVRADVQTDDNVLFAGVILGGVTPKRVLCTGLGPSLQSSIPGALNDPTLELHDGNGALLMGNDDWRTAPNAAEIQATGLAPKDDREAAILMTLSAGNYTTIVRGVNRATTGIGLAEVFKLDN